MKREGSRFFVKFVWVIVWIFVMFGSSITEKLTDGQPEYEPDTAMRTTAFNVDVVVNADNSYQVTEHIRVDFLTSRQGIYRYIPYKGVVDSYDESKQHEIVPYYAEITDIHASEDISIENSNGNKVLRLGTEGNYHHGEKEYELSYKITPRLQNQDYYNVYCNVIPNLWQNAIPGGSKISVTFPKDFDHDRLTFVYGEQGEGKDASGLLDLKWEGNTVIGTLNDDLPLAQGVTLSGFMGDGYFTGSEDMGFLPWLLLLPAVAVFLMILVLFLKYGRDEAIITSIQYQPPDNLDSAAVGYIIDGAVEDKDLLSLIIYWADKGVLRIEEVDEKELRLVKLRELPVDAPNYQSCIFQKLFEGGNERDIKTLQYHFAGTLDMARKQLANSFGKGGKSSLYVKASERARVFSLFLCTLPMGIFMLFTSKYSYTSAARGVSEIILWFVMLVGSILFSHTIDKWYAKTSVSRKSSAALALGMCVLSTAAYVGSYLMRVRQHEIFNYRVILIFVLVMTGIMIVMAGFMKRRTDQCLEWMGRLAGLREFIETAELDRMNEIAKINPEYFYHIIPYAYVFGLSDVFAEKLKGLSLPAPEWYTPHRSYSFFDFYMFNHLMVGGLNQTVNTLTVVEAPRTGGTGGSGGFGGGYSGGGFSGGGFGGGGGGSW